MMRLDIVNYDTAQLLKSIGFNEPCRYRFIDGDEGTIIECNSIDEVYSPQISIEQYKWCLAPTQALVQMWLIHTHKLVISIDYDDTEEYFISISRIPFKELGIGGDYPTYEQALEVAIQDAIHLIKVELETDKPPQVNIPFVDWLGLEYPRMKNHGDTMNIHQIDRVFEEYKDATTWKV